MNSRRKPMLLLAGCLTALLILAFGCAHFTKKHNGATVHAQDGRPSGSVHRRSAKAPTLAKHQDSAVSNPNAACPVVSTASNESANRQENASGSPRPLGPGVVQVLVTVSSELTPDPGYRFFRQQAEREHQSGLGWKHFRPQTQAGQ
jgi:hypothetical protein